MEARRRLLLAQPQTIGGIIVGENNASYYNNGYRTDVIADDRFFLTTVIDTGNTSQKQYSVLRCGSGADGVYRALRMFNDLDATSVDYWSTVEDTSIAPYDYAFNSVGRYIIATIYKPYADLFYLANRATGEYYIKGKNVI